MGVPFDLESFRRLCRPLQAIKQGDFILVAWRAAAYRAPESALILP